MQISSTRSLDLTPSPRVLRMLGQIDFKPWQCLAELIDNSVDSFLTARVDGNGIVHPRIMVEASPIQEIRAGRGSITVTDNGTGMSPEELERAVRAGYSGNNPVDKLGLFGMGFNVATARLGNRTEVWTTRATDDHWSGVRIDFDEIERAASYQVPAMSRPKTPEEKNDRGTSITVSKLDRERAAYLRSPGGLRVTKERLSNIYSRVIREIGVDIAVLGGASLKAKSFCTWAPTRIVETKGRFGRIPAVIKIDQDFGSRDYCTTCWVWLLKNDKFCPGCGSTDNLTKRERRVSGWIGIQRFFDQDDYGFDLIRNGRVIETKSKEFFSWTDPNDGTVVPEYPIEQQHWGGRIVGELNLDFVPLASHQKDAFDRNSQQWQLAVETIRGKGPILQEIRKNKGFEDPNESPLARLHAGFRRGNPPGFRWLVPGDTEGHGINRECQKWAALFWEGSEEYETDEKWWQAVVVGEEARKKGKGKSVPEALSGDEEFSGEDDSDPPEEAGTEPKQLPKFQHEVVEALTRRVEFTEIPAAPIFELRTEFVTAGSLPSGLHMEVATAGNSITAIIDPKHPVFTQSLTSPLDCLIEELGYQILQRANESINIWSLSRIIYTLRQQYFDAAISTISSIREDASALLGDALEYLAGALPAQAPIHSGAVPADQASEVARNVMLRDRKGASRVEEVITSGIYPRYLDRTRLPELFMQYPDLFLDGHFFAQAYESVESTLRPEVVQRVHTSLGDAVWAADFDESVIGGPETRFQLTRVQASVQLLRSWIV